MLSKAYLNHFKDQYFHAYTKIVTKQSWPWDIWSNRTATNTGLGLAQSSNLILQARPTHGQCSSYIHACFAMTKQRIHFLETECISSVYSLSSLAFSQLQTVIKYMLSTGAAIHVYAHISTLEAENYLTMYLGNMTCQTHLWKGGFCATKIEWSTATEKACQCATRSEMQK